MPKWTSKSRLSNAIKHCSKQSQKMHKSYTWEVKLTLYDRKLRNLLLETTEKPTRSVSLTTNLHNIPMNYWLNCALNSTKTIRNLTKVVSRVHEEAETVLFLHKALWTRCDLSHKIPGWRPFLGGPTRFSNTILHFSYLWPSL